MAALSAARREHDTGTVTRGRAIWARMMRKAEKLGVAGKSEGRTVNRSRNVSS